MFEAVLLDFYGTVVHEDDLVVASICRTIADAARGAPDPLAVGLHWGASFSAVCSASHGAQFRTQRDIELQSLVSTIEHFGARCDAHALGALMFEHWVRPPLFHDAVAFLDAVDLPTVVLSNIDRHDLEACLDLHQLQFTGVVASEDARAYKPHRAMFEAGLRVAGVRDPRRVLHIGDSIASDVHGANDAGIPVAWLNRSQKPSATSKGRPDYVIRTLTELLPLQRLSPRE